METKIIFSEESRKQVKKMREDKNKEQILKIMQKKIEELRENKNIGTQIAKKKIPKKYLKEYKIENLWKCNLAQGWRILYTIKGEEIESDMIINANSLDELKEEFEKMDALLIGIYKEKTGLDETKLLALMSQDTDVAENAISFGFATGTYEGEAKQKNMNTCVMFNALYKNILNQKLDNMANEQTTEKLNAIESALQKVSNLLFGKVKNMTVELEDGNQIYVYSEDGEFEGKRAVLTDGEGLPTEENAPAGEYRLRDGRVIVVGEGGIIESVSEAADAEALASELAAMEDEKKKMAEENEELKAKLNALETETAEKEATYKEQFENLQNEMKALKEEVIGEPSEPAPVKALVDSDEWENLSPSEKFRRKMVAKAQNK